MTGFLLDTNVPSELTRIQSNQGVEEWLNAAEDEQLFLSVVTLGEMLKGVALLPQGKRREELRRWIDHALRPWFDGRILPVTEEVAERWGVLAAECQLKGRGLSMADGLIAATALEHDLTVVTHNVRDFADLGVALIDPFSSSGM